MKRKLFLQLITCLLSLSAFSSPAAAQTNADDDDYPKNVIRINPASLLLNNYSLFYERALRDKYNLSLQLGANYMTNDWTTSTNFDGTNYTGNLSNRGFGFTPEVRCYFLRDVTDGEFGKPAPYGLFVSGFGRYMQNDFTFNFKANNIDENLKFRTQIYTLGATFGAQGILAKRVAVELFFGPDVNFGKAKITEYPDVKFFEGDELKWVDTNWATRQILNYIARPSVSSFFPGVRAGVSAGIAF